MNPWIILAIGAAFVVNGFYWHHAGRGSADIEWTARIEKERADAATQARATERKQQETTNHALAEQNATLASVADRLRRELDRLRHRPERPAPMPDAPRAACAGSTGAELSRPDAEFLAGEAARADTIRAGLVACYAHVDGLSR